MENSETACCEVDHSQHDSFEEETDRWDKLGIFLSGLCAVHCLVTPLLVLGMPVLGGFFEQEWVHALMALFVVPVGFYAFWSGYKHHKQMKVFGLGAVGICFVAGALLASHEITELFGHDILTVTGSIMLITAHVLNRRACACHIPH